MFVSNLQESVLSIGWVIGPVVGGYGAQIGGFGTPFFITAALAFICYPLLFWLMPKGKKCMHTKKCTDTQQNSQLW